MNNSTTGEIQIITDEPNSKGNIYKHYQLLRHDEKKWYSLLQKFAGEKVKITFEKVE